MLYSLSDLATWLLPSRFNRRLHALAAWLSLPVHTVGTCVMQAQLVPPAQEPHGNLNPGYPRDP